MAVDNRRRIMPDGPGIGHVIFDTRSAGNVFAFEDTGRNQHPTGMADLANNPFSPIEVADHLQDHRETTDRIGRPTAGNQNPVIVIRIDVSIGQVGDAGHTVLTDVLFAGFLPYNMNGNPFFP